MNNTIKMLVLMFIILRIIQACSIVFQIAPSENYFQILHCGKTFDICLGIL